MTDTTIPDARPSVGHDRRPLDPDVADLLRSSLRHVLTEVTDTPLADRLAALGWDEVLADNAPAALGLLFELKGATLSAADALGVQLAATLAEITGDASLASASVTVPSPFGPSTLEADALEVETMALSDVRGRDLVIVVGDRLAVCPSTGLAAAPVHGVDDSLSFVRITGRVPAGAVRWIDDGVADRLVATGRRLIACELVGIGRQVVQTAVEYTKVRVQYGKPIGVFQALQHRLASAHALVIGAGHLADEAGFAGDAWSAIVAKAMAGHAAEFACTQAQQCFGAIGFTWEHEFHRYLRRASTLDRLLGDWRSLEHEIGERLQATGTVPRIGSL